MTVCDAGRESYVDEEENLLLASNHFVIRFGVVMESHFSGLNDSIPDRKRREKRFTAHRRKTFTRAIGSVLFLICAVAAGAAIAEGIIFREQHIVARSIGSFGCGGLAALITIFCYAYFISWESVESQILGEDNSAEAASGQHLWMLAMGIAWLVAPWGAYEGLWGQLPRGLPILIGGYGGGLFAVGAIILLNLKSRGMLR